MKYWDFRSGEDNFYFNCSSPSTSMTALQETPQWKKYVYNTTVIGLILDSEESVYGLELEQLVYWCIQNHVESNFLKTVEMIMDYGRSPPIQPLPKILKNTVSAVDTFRFSRIDNFSGPELDLPHRHCLEEGQQMLYTHTQAL